MRENENPDKLDPRELTKQQHNVLDATRLLEREAPRLIRSAATITYELHQWGVDISYSNVQTVTRGLAEDGVLRKEKIDPNDPRRESKGLLPFELTVTQETRGAIFDHLTERLDMWDSTRPTFSRPKRSEPRSSGERGRGIPARQYPLVLDVSKQ